MSADFSQTMSDIKYLKNSVTSQVFYSTFSIIKIIIFYIICLLLYIGSQQLIYSAKIFVTKVIAYMQTFSHDLSSFYKISQMTNLGCLAP